MVIDMFDITGKRIGGEKSLFAYRVLCRMMEEMGDDDKQLTLGFGKIEFVDSSGLGSLVAINSTLIKMGRGLVVNNPNDGFIQLLRVTNLDRIIATSKEKIHFDKAVSQRLKEIIDEIESKGKTTTQAWHPYQTAPAISERPVVIVNESAKNLPETPPPENRNVFSSMKKCLSAIFNRILKRT